MANQALQSTDERERALLASYAMFSNLSEGRRYEEDEHPYRSFFQEIVIELSTVLLIVV